MKRFGTVFFWASVASTIYSIWSDYKKKQETVSSVDRRRDDLAQGYDQTTTHLPEGTQVINFRGSYDDVMSALNPGYSCEKPPLPDDLDVENLPKYYFGCPHCRESSMYGTTLWRYHELERTRERGDNTTTFLAKCKKCNGFMRATVDHDD